MTLCVLKVYDVDLEHHSNTPFVYTMGVNTKRLSVDSHDNVSGIKFLHFGQSCHEVLSLYQ